ncbi:MAG: glutamate racemase [Hymenobacter sp.]|nr:MAG: glutamate racemase [Hymenobacter sp.]
MNIGVFDSGSGGLTIMRRLEEVFPDRSFVYLGDHANIPYGSKSEEQIYALVLTGLEHLFRADCTLVIIACNTAVARGLRRLQREWLPLFYPDRRVLGVIVPVVESLTGMPWLAEQLPLARSPQARELTVGVFATQHTVASGVFAGEIHKRAPHIRVWQQACPSLVPLLEANASQVTLQVAVDKYAACLLEQLSGTRLDACLLGCTHYPLLEACFRESLPVGVQLFSQPAITAASLGAYLARHPEFSTTHGSSRTFLTTGVPAVVSQLASKFYGRAVIFLSIEQAGSLTQGIVKKLG